MPPQLEAALNSSGGPVEPEQLRHQDHRSGVEIIAEGWSIVLSNVGFALRSPMQHAPAIEAALSDMKSLGLKAAARLLLAAAPTVKASAVGKLKHRPMSGNEWQGHCRQVAHGLALGVSLRSNSEMR